MTNLTKHFTILDQKLNIEFIVPSLETYIDFCGSKTGNNRFERAEETPSKSKIINPNGIFEKDFEGDNRNMSYT